MNPDHCQQIKARLGEDKKWEGVIDWFSFLVKSVSKSPIFTYFRKRDFDVGLERMRREFHACFVSLQRNCLNISNQHDIICKGERKESWSAQMDLKTKVSALTE